MKNYYNEHDPNAAAWLRELIADGQIPKGEVDERSISEVLPSDLDGFVQHHFFCGIGGWPLALRLAGFPDSRSVWTGSCPCQPFSVAGKGGGTADDRHLWPDFWWLIAQCRPTVVFGEQVASRAGREWLAGVRLDMETLGYAVGAADLCAASVGAPHIRQRLFWLADAQLPERRAGGEPRPRMAGQHAVQQGWEEDPDRHPDDRPNGRLGHALEPGLEGQSRHGAGRDGQEREVPEQDRPARAAGDAPDWLEHATGNGQDERRPESGQRGIVGGCREGGMVDTDSSGRASRKHAGTSARHGGAAVPAGGDFWDDAVWIPCADGKARRIKRGLEPVVAGLPRGMVYSGDPGDPAYAENTAEARVMRLRGYGNAIVPQLAAAFVRASLETGA